MPGSRRTNRRCRCSRRLLVREHLRQDQRHRPHAGRRTGAGSPAFALCTRVDAAASGRDGVPVLQGRRHLGRQYSGRLGVRDNQLRVVGRHRPCRHVHFGFPAVAAPEVADIDQSLRRGDDDLRGGDGGSDADPAPWPSVVFLLADALPRHHEPLAAVAQPAGVGHLRHRHLHHRVDPVLVHGADSRPRDPARPRHDAAPSRSSTDSARSGGAAKRGSGAASIPRIC